MKLQRLISILIFSSLLFLSFSSKQRHFIHNDNPLHSHIDSLIDEKVRAYYKDSRAVGLSIVVILRGQFFYYNYGEIRNGSGILPKSNTIYEIGSVTKTFTGILLAHALLDHKVGLDDDIRKYLPGKFPNLVYQNVPITIRHLANHTSGITRIFPNAWERPGYEDADPLKGYGREGLYQGLRQMKLAAIPGEKYGYSNMAVALLGYILEDIYGKSYSTQVDRQILKPLRMTHTVTDLHLLSAKAVAVPHDDAKKVVPFWTLSGVPAMGTLGSCTSDLARYIAANNTEKDPAIRLSHQPTFGTTQEGMGLNWFLHEIDGQRNVEHSGGTGGSRSSLQCYPSLNSGFAILTNSLANRNDLEKEMAKLVRQEASESGAKTR
ncbi:serine hydrolase domain-containing protein [Pedobacter paludis]|uniref:Beta-lactamase-related domain-containing protein n=1 Tax=Pedobacter paludis TaxID=2203212 RepID=A0A317F454_9SPHI|nr:serine hydrolase domain-containing protein [Pedobacter paludis]PWS32268.1 hypothetical protein DF947_10900 [Pedobacter paludis]